MAGARCWPRSPCLGAHAATPFGLDDYYLLATVSEPAFSPSGERDRLHRLAQRQEARQGHERYLGRDRGAAAIPRSSRARQRRSEWQPRLREATARRCFSSAMPARTKITQLWRLSARGGGARQVTKIAGGISDFDLSPDGKRAVVVAEVGRTVGSKTEIPPPIETERFLFKRDGDGYLDDRTQQLFIVDLATGKARQLTSGQRDHWHPAWSPDGTVDRVRRARSAARRTATRTTKSSCRRSTAGAAEDQHFRGRRQRSGLGGAPLLVAGFAPRALARRRRGQVDLLRAVPARRRRPRDRRSDAPRAHRSLVLLSEVRARRLDPRADRTGPRHLARAHRSPRAARSTT